MTFLISRLGGGAAQRQDPPFLAPREREATVDDQIRRQLGIVLTGPEEDAPLGGQSTRKDAPSLRIEPEGPRGDHVNVLRKTGRQRNLDSSIEAPAGQRGLTGSGGKKGPLALSWLDESHLEAGAGASEDQPGKTRPRAQIETTPCVAREKRESRERFAVMAGQDLTDRSGSDEIRSPVPDPELPIVSEESVDRPLVERLRRKPAQGIREIATRDLRKRERHKEDCFT
jgi:hypothetical protein